MHKHPHQHLHFLVNRELNELYITVAIRSFALAMITIFIPIYLLNIGYPLPTVLIFFAIASLTQVVFTMPAASIAAKYGFKHAIFFSTPLLILFYLLLYTQGHVFWILPLLAVIAGISNSLFWLSYHVDFSLFSDKKKRAQEVSFAKVSSLIFHVLGPIVGGFLVVLLGFQFLFVLVSILLLLSVIPLFFSKDVQTTKRYSIKDVFRGQTKRNFFTFFGCGIDTGVFLVFWPLVVFFAVYKNSYTGLGMISSLGLFAAMVWILIIGRIGNKYQRFMLRIGGVANSVVWMLKTIFLGPIQMLILHPLHGIAQATIAVPFQAITYDKANKSKILKFIMFREMTIHMGRVFLFLVMAMVTWLVGSFVLGAGASLLYLLF